MARPIPDVPECDGHGGTDQMCHQCNGSHAHDWVRAVISPGVVAWRCRVCGGRRCDVRTVGDAQCVERRHHRGPHMDDAGRLYVLV